MGGAYTYHMLGTIPYGSPFDCCQFVALPTKANCELYVGVGMDKSEFGHSSLVSLWRLIKEGVASKAGKIPNGLQIPIP